MSWEKNKKLHCSRKIQHSYLGAINWHKFASSKHVLWDILEKDFWMMHLELRIKHFKEQFGTGQK